MKKHINIEIGNRVQKKRQECGYTREKLAELTSLSPRFIANVEQGDAGFSINSLKKVCEVLGVTSDYLIWGMIEECNEIKALTNKLVYVDKRYLPILGVAIQKMIEIVQMKEE